MNQLKSYKSYMPAFKQSQNPFNPPNNANSADLAPTYNALINSKAYDYQFNDSIMDAVQEKSKGNFDKAIKIYSGIYKENNKEIRAISGLADCYSQKGDFPKAYQFINEAKQIAPNLDNISRIEKKIFFEQKGISNKLLAKNLKKQVSNNNLQIARTMVENFSIPLKAALKGVPVNFGETDPDAIGQCDGAAITINEKILGMAAPQVIAAVIAHEAVHAGDRDYDIVENKDSITEEVDAFEEAAKVWEKCKGSVVDLDADESSNIYKEQGRKGLDSFVRKLYQDNYAANYEYSPGHYEEAKPHVPGAVTCKTRNGFITVNQLKGLNK